MFPDASGLPSAADSTAAQTGKSFLFDFAAGDFVIHDGRLVIADEASAIKIWIEKVLHTEKDRFEIYADTEYGCRLEDLIIGKGYSAAFIESELRREVEDALLQNTKITAIASFTLERTASGINVSMEVKTNGAGGDTVTLAL